MKKGARLPRHCWLGANTKGLSMKTTMSGCWCRLQNSKETGPTPRAKSMCKKHGLLALALVLSSSMQPLLQRVLRRKCAQLCVNWIYTTPAPTLSSVGEAQQEPWMIGAVLCLGRLLIHTGNSIAWMETTCQLPRTPSTRFGFATAATLHLSGGRVSMHIVAWNTRASLPPQCCQRQSPKVGRARRPWQ